jgi:hypothetical protein
MMILQIGAILVFEKDRNGRFPAFGETRKILLRSVADEKRERTERP